MTRSEMNLLDLSMIVPFAMMAYIYLEVTFIEQKLLLVISLVSYCLSVCLSVLLSVYMSVCLSFCLSICLSVLLSFCSFCDDCLHIYLEVYLH
jgi:hypothetical protein